MHDLQHLSKLMSSFDTAMLVTHDGEGMRARPMAIAPTKEVDRLCFVTRVDTDKVGELVDEPTVAVTMQSSSAYLSISGKARVVNERAKLEEVWHPGLDAWFEEGIDDPRAAVIEINADTAEYWEMSPMNKLRAAYEYAKARITDETVPASELGEHVRIAL